MCIVNSFCGCCGLRSAVTVIGILGFITSIIMCYEASDYMSTQMTVKDVFSPRILLVTSICGILLYAFLLVAIFKPSTLYLYYFVILYAVYLGEILIHAIIDLVMRLGKKYENSVLIFLGTMIYFTFLVYLWVIVYSYYRVLDNPDEIPDVSIIVEKEENVKTPV